MKTWMTPVINIVNLSAKVINTNVIVLMNR